MRTEQQERKRKSENSDDESRQAKREKINTSEASESLTSPSEIKTESNSIEVKNELIDKTCSITKRLYANPVDTNCNHTFEEEAILEWISKNNVPAVTPTDNNNDDRPAPCPCCRAPVHPTQLTSNQDKKKEVDDFLLENPEKMQDRFCEKKLQDALVTALNKNEVKKVEEILSNNLHMFFVAMIGSARFLTTISGVASFEMFKACLDILKPHPSILNLFIKLVYKSHNTILHHTCFSGNLAKVKYLLEDLNLASDMTALRAKTIYNENILFKACASKNIELFSYLLNLLKDQAKEMILEFHTDNKIATSNTFSVACGSDTPALVSSILKLFKDADNNIISNQLFYMPTNDIFTVMSNNRYNSLPITQMANDFLKTKFSHDEIKCLKSIMKKRCINILHHKLYTFFTQQTKTMTDLDKKLKNLDAKVDHLHEHQGPSILPLIGMFRFGNNSPTLARISQNTTHSSTTSTSTDDNHDNFFNL